MILKTDTNITSFFLIFTLKMSDNYPGHYFMDVSWACHLLFARPCSNKKKVKVSSYTRFAFVCHPQALVMGKRKCLRQHHFALRLLCYYDGL